MLRFVFAMLKELLILSFMFSTYLLAMSGSFFLKYSSSMSSKTVTFPSCWSFSTVWWKIFSRSRRLTSGIKIFDQKPFQTVFVWCFHVPTYNIQNIIYWDSSPNLFVLCLRMLLSKSRTDFICFYWAKIVISHVVLSTKTDTVYKFYHFFSIKIRYNKEWYRITMLNLHQI